MKKELPRTKSSLKPRQARSRESEKKLMQATVELLGRFGLEGASIPRVAECAGLTPGAVYRRFADKNALMERVILGILESQFKQLQRMLTVEIADAETLAALVQSLVHAMLVSHRQNATLIGAMRQFVRGSDHLAFKRKATELENRSLEHLVKVLMMKRKRIRHPDPEPALRLAFLALSNTLVVLCRDDGGSERWAQILPADDAWLERELVRMFLGYIGAT